MKKFAREGCFRFHCERRQVIKDYAMTHYFPELLGLVINQQDFIATFVMMSVTASISERYLTSVQEVVTLFYIASYYKKCRDEDSTFFSTDPDPAKLENIPDLEPSFFA